MAFPFYGSFSVAQWDELANFGRIQSKDIIDRIKWLNVQIQKIGVFETIYNNNIPVSFTVSPITSYGAKLLQAYKILGGVPERDMLLRTSDDPVFLTEGVGINQQNSESMSSGGYSTEYSNSRQARTNQSPDRTLGLKIEKFKKWQLDAIKHKREHLEFKIKRALDYYDQLNNEMKLLTDMNGANFRAPVIFQINEIIGMFSDPESNVSIDGDIYGLSTPDNTIEQISKEISKEV